MDHSNEVVVPPEPLDAETESALDVLAGRCEIVETEVWGKDALDLEEKAYFTIGSREAYRAYGHWRMIAMEADLDFLITLIQGIPHFEFSWYGSTTPRKRGNGRGWGILKSKDRIEGRIFIHRGDDSSFVAVRTKE